MGQEQKIQAREESKKWGTCDPQSPPAPCRQPEVMPIAIRDHQLEMGSGGWNRWVLPSSTKHKHISQPSEAEVSSHLAET